MIFGKRLKTLREKKRLTQEELGKKLNLQKAVISKYENGKLQPSIETISFLADFFNVTTDYLLGHSDNPRPLDSKTPDFDNYDYQAKTLADALIELSTLHFKYHFDDDMMTKLVRKAIAKYGAPQPVVTDPAAHGPGVVNSNLLRLEGIRHDTEPLIFPIVPDNLHSPLLVCAVHNAPKNCLL